MGIAKRLTNKINDIHDQAKSANSGAAVYMGDNVMLTRLYNGQKMYVDTRDGSETPHLAMDGYWELNITRVFELLVEDGDVVFDVGSTYGYYALVAGRQGAGRVVCVDPNPIYETYLKKNLTVNGLIQGAVIEQVAIGGKKGTTELHLLKDDWNSATTQSLEDFVANRKVPYELDKTVKVDVATIDALATKHDIQEVGVLKLDIEGQEEAAYPAMRKTIDASPRLKLLLEFSPENYTDPKKFFAAITSDFGHVYVMPAGNNIQRVNSYDELQTAADTDWMMLLASKVDLDQVLEAL